MKKVMAQLPTDNRLQELLYIDDLQVSYLHLDPKIIEKENCDRA